MSGRVASSAPGWFDAALLAATSTVLGVGAVALLLAFVGDYGLGWALAGGLAASAGIAVLGWPAVRGSRPAVRGPRPADGPGECSERPGSDRPATWAAVAMCAVALASVVANSGYESNHVEINRDPGVYAATAKWIDTQGSLQVPPDPQWQASGVAVVLDSLGTYSKSDGGVQLQFSHFVPAVFAVADGIGGDRAMFAMPAVLGGLALLAVYAAGCQLCRRPWLVVAAVTALAVSLPQVNVSRDTYSEAGTELLLWSAVWLTLRWVAKPDVRLAAAAGLTLGGVLLTRIDALVYLVPLPVLFAVLWHGRRDVGRDLAVFVLAILPGFALATLDLVCRSAGYYRLLRSQVLQLRLGLAASVVVAGVLWWLVRGGHRWRAGERVLARCGPAGVGVLLLAGWLIRPHLDHPRLAAPNDVVSGLQQHEGQPVDALDSYGQKTLVWMSWYLGPVTLALAIIGLVGLTALALRRRREPRADSALALLGMLGVASALYLWKPSIVPDQIWASRRFAPATLPLLVVAAAVGIEFLTDWFDRRRARAAVATMAAAAVIAAPALSSAKVVRYTTQDGYLSIIDDTCRALGPDAAVVFNPGGRLELTFPQTIRSWCGAPTASLPAGAGAAEVAALAHSWRTSGRTLWVLSDSVADVSAVLPAPSQVTELGAATSRHELIQTIARLPDGYTSETVRIFGARAD